MQIREHKVFENLDLWFIVNQEFRKKITGEVSNTKTVKINFLIVLYNLLLSSLGLLWIIIRRKRYKNLILPHLRQFQVDGKYIERLTDPLIEYSSIKDSYIILEFPANGLHKRPRTFKRKSVNFDFLILLQLIFSYLFSPFFKWKYQSQIDELLKDLSKHFNITNDYGKIFLDSMVDYYFYYKCYKLLVRIIAPKRVFMAPRAGYYASIIPLCKRNNIVVCELQHGITLGETVLYGGEYNSFYDPDYFLAFGDANIGKHFRMPLDRIINIGFAYKKFLSNNGIRTKCYDDNTILVISEPHITEVIIDTIKLLSDFRPELKFHLRLHPQESLNKSMNNFIDDIQNLIVVDNKTESFVCLNEYTFVLGENSSVLFEATSLNKKVGRLSINGLNAILNGLYGGEVINSLNDFDKFIKSFNISDNEQQIVYSNFNSEIIDKL